MMIIKLVQIFDVVRLEVERFVGKILFMVYGCWLYLEIIQLYLAVIQGNGIDYIVNFSSYWFFVI